MNSVVLEVGRRATKFEQDSKTNQTPDTALIEKWVDELSIKHTFGDWFTEEQHQVDLLDGLSKEEFEDLNIDDFEDLVISDEFNATAVELIMKRKGFVPLSPDDMDVEVKKEYLKYYGLKRK